MAELPELTGEMVREIADMIRERYALDLRIWRSCSGRSDVEVIPEDKLMDMMKDSDYLLARLKYLLEFHRTSFAMSAEDREKLENIIKRLKGGARPYDGKFPEASPVVNGPEDQAATNGVSNGNMESAGE